MSKNTKLRTSLILLVVSIVVVMLTVVRSFVPVKSMSRSFSLSHRKAVKSINMQSTMAPVRVRFAPSPTGSLHVGGARTALFNWLIARKTNGKFIIRVEDTDEARSTRASENSILSDLKWMNMNWDEGPIIDGPHGPYRQSERKTIYKEVADNLIAAGLAYPCFCTEEELDAKREAAEAAGLDPKYDGTWRDADPAEVKLRLERGDPHTVRFKVPEGKVCYIDDIVRGRVTWDADASLGDFIILRSNGMPVYNFCVAVDDAKMQITHVIRAEEHLTNTLRQLLVLEGMGAKPPQYAHCSLILGSDRSKLSKRHGATSVQQFSEQGFLPAAMMNYLANLGWNDGTDKEIYTPEELIGAFDLSRIVKSAAVFDMDKLKWINGQHLRQLPLDKVEGLVVDVLRGGDSPVLPPSTGSPQEGLFITLASKVAQRDMQLLTEAKALVGNALLFDLKGTIETDEHVAEVLADKEGLTKVIAKLAQDFESGAMPYGQDEAFLGEWKKYMKSLGKELGLKGKALFHPVRLSLTGKMSGPEIGDQLQLLHASEGMLAPSYPAVSLKQRLEVLKALDIDAALLTATEAAARRGAAAAAAVAVAVAENVVAVAAKVPQL